MERNTVTKSITKVNQPLPNTNIKKRKQSFAWKANKQAMWNYLWIVLFLLKVTTPVESLDPDEKRPIWNIAHMVNAIAQVNYYLNQGANALEFDIEFDRQGNALYTHHGVPCDCFRDCIRWEYIDTYLDYMRQLTTPGNKKFRKDLVLLYLDLKVQSLSSSALRNAAKNLASKLINQYWKKGTSGARAYLLVALPSLEQIEFVKTFQQALRSDSTFNQEDKIGYTFLGNEETWKVDSVLKRSQISTNIWQADGTSNCFYRGYGRLDHLLAKRNEEDSVYYNKVFFWTIDLPKTMKAVLSLGTDAIVTNYPGNLAYHVLKEKLFSNYVRLADIDDNPWQKHPGKGKIPYVETGWGCSNRS